ncbi:MAG: hypothetical protein Q8P41_31720 [Pseudomonadota bacterium]|nr:hypothetical protein [Pseudomonadota bacterium]
MDATLLRDTLSALGVAAAAFLVSFGFFAGVSWWDRRRAGRRAAATAKILEELRTKGYAVIPKGTKFDYWPLGPDGPK